MVATLKKGLNFLNNMGWRYVRFRIKNEILRKTGLLKSKFPTSPELIHYVKLKDWKNSKNSFFFSAKSSLLFSKKPSQQIADRFYKIENGKFIFFNSVEFSLGKDYDWITNPETGFKYNNTKHWTQIADYSAEAGDIKYVWEKSRFSFLYDIIRYDYHYDRDCAEFTFSEIISWIKNNPVNCGPNYRCSQEISLRVLNWTFALHYYRDSPFLTEEVFSNIQYAIYWQIDHVYKHINFSRIAVRNNHAITETLILYLIGTLYPFYPNADKWKMKGKQWFEEEINYQIYDDGTFLQFSMNYHRVVIQLLTWAIVLAEKNGESFNTTVYNKAKKSIEFLRTCMIDENGFLPNYGANDGALFFKLNDCHYRDFRPALFSLATALKIDLLFKEKYEDIYWYNITTTTNEIWQPATGPHVFEVSGYYILRQVESLTFIRCGRHKDRPSQADNLHLDIWIGKDNLIRDAGSYKYNTDAETLNYFVGTAAHNTVMLGQHDQMQKGSRFIWFNWTQALTGSWQEYEDYYEFIGTIKAFEQVSKNITHTRAVRAYKRQLSWYIADTINHDTNLPIYQLWHPSKSDDYTIKLDASTSDKKPLIQVERLGWYSSEYGVKEKTDDIIFSTSEKVISTSLQVI